MHPARFALPRPVNSARFAVTPARPLLVDPVSRYCLVAPLLRRELDQLRGRLGTPGEQRGDRRQLAATSRRLAELLRVTFA